MPQLSRYDRYVIEFWKTFHLDACKISIEISAILFFVHLDKATIKIPCCKSSQSWLLFFVEDMEYCMRPCCIFTCVGHQLT